MRSSARSSLSNTRALPVNRSPSLPVILATAPLVARLPYNTTRCPSGLIGSSNERITVCPAGYGGTSARFSASVRPVTVRQSPCSRPRSRSIFINGNSPPMATSSAMTCLPLGLRSANTGTRAPIRVKSSMSSGTSAACAMASRCSTALVDPPSAVTTVMAFSNACARHDVARPEVAPDHEIGDGRPGVVAIAFLVVADGGLRAGIGQAHAHRLNGRCHRVGRVHAAARTRPRDRATLDVGQFAVVDLARRVLADRLEHADDVQVLAAQAAGQDRAAVDEHRRAVEPGQRHQAAGHVLVAAADGHESRRNPRRPRPFRWNRR